MTNSVLYDFNDVEKNVFHEVITAMGEAGIEAQLTADDILRVMAVPMTRLDYDTVPPQKLKTVMRSVRDFMVASRRRFDSMTKIGIAHYLEKEWLSALSEEQKRAMVTEYSLFSGFDNDGFAIINPTLHKINATLGKPQRPIAYKAIARPSNGGPLLKIGTDSEFKTFVNRPDAEGRWTCDLHITEGNWYDILQGVSEKTKRMLQAYLQMPDYRSSCKGIEVAFGLHKHGIEGCVVGLGQRARRMMADFEVVDENDLENPRIWPIAMGLGRWENGQFVWQLRPELARAAKRYLAECNFQPLDLIDMPK